MQTTNSIRVLDFSDETREDRAKVKSTRIKQLLDKKERGYSKLDCYVYFPKSFVDEYYGDKKEGK